MKHPPCRVPLTVDQDVHLHRVGGRRRSAAAATAAVAGVITGVADVGLGDEEARHLMRVIYIIMRPNDIPFEQMGDNLFWFVG